MNIPYDRSYFFDEGLRFTCTQCGKCCTGDPGVVYASTSEIMAMARFLDLLPQNFIRTYLYPYKDSYSIKEHSDGRCYFFNKKKGCRIYSVRPLQCRTYPFWYDTLKSRYRWKKEALLCPGIGKGRLYTRDEILVTLAQTL